MSERYTQAVEKTRSHFPFPTTLISHSFLLCSLTMKIGFLCLQWLCPTPVIVPLLPTACLGMTQFSNPCLNVTPIRSLFCLSSLSRSLVSLLVILHHHTLFLSLSIYHHVFTNCCVVASISWKGRWPCLFNSAVYMQCLAYEERIVVGW